LIKIILISLRIKRREGNVNRDREREREREGGKEGKRQNRKMRRVGEKR
jgi:hypothetical protein